MAHLAFLSDTRMAHETIPLPSVDVTVHTGNFTATGTWDETLAFLEWFGGLRGHKVVVPGRLDAVASLQVSRFRAACRGMGVDLLHGKPLERAGVKLWGMGATVGEDSLFMSLPFVDKLDVLVTHDAPRDIGDFDWFVGATGSAFVRKIALEARPRVHVFGGAPASAGTYPCPDGTGTLFVNAGIGRVGRPKPIVVNLNERVAREDSRGA